jgi:methylase of polypeptide subunit release factors
MREANILYLVVSKFCDVDLHPQEVPNEQMGLIFENLIRRFNELANETAGDHFTPREVIRLMVNILFIHDDKLLATPGTVRKLLDPACGTGGMLAEAQNYLREHHGAANLYVYGQDYNKRAFATAASDMLMKQVDHNGAGNNVRFGDSFTDDQFKDETFDYFLTNPPFGVDWKKQQKEIQIEHDKRGFDGRFGAGLPRVNDGALLFLQHMLDKFEHVRPAERKHGSRLAIVFSGSPLFTGGAGSGESDIRKWVIENDWLEAIVALPAAKVAKKQTEIDQIRGLMKAGTLSQAVAQAAIAHAEEELRTLNQAEPAREEKQTAKILRMLPRAAEAMRARLQTGNLGLKDPRSIIQGRNTLFGLFNGRVPMRPAALKPGERPYLIARVGINRDVLLQAAASAAGCVENGSGGVIIEPPTVLRLPLAL